MKLFSNLIFLLTGIATALVFDVSEASYDDLIAREMPTFLLFYTWTHDAVALNGYYSDFSRVYENDNLLFARIDATENPNIVKKFDLPKLPCVVFYHPGADPEVEVLNLPPVKAIKRKIRHDLGIDHTNDHVNYPLNLLNDNTFRLGIQGKAALVLFTGTCADCEHVTEVFRKIAADYRYSDNVAIADVDPARVDSQLLPDVFSIVHLPSVLFFSEEGSQIPLQPQLYKGPLTYEALTEFMEKHNLSPIGSVGQFLRVVKKAWRTLLGSRVGEL